MVDASSTSAVVFYHELSERSYNSADTLLERLQTRNRGKLASESSVSPVDDSIIHMSAGSPGTEERAARV